MGDAELLTFLAVVQSATGAGWTFACACRISMMNHTSHRRLRVAVSVFAAGGLFFAAGPWVSSPYHALFDTLAGASVVASLWVTAALWRRGVPYQFLRSSHFPPTTRAAEVDDA